MASCAECGRTGLGIFEVKDGKCPSCRRREEGMTDTERAERKATKEKAASQARDLIVTTETFVGGDVERLGVVATEIVLGMNIFKDIAASFRDVFGGRSGVVQNTLRDAREIGFEDLRLKAVGLGANAIIAVDIDYHSISTGSGLNVLMVSVSGTAVRMAGST